MRYYDWLIYNTSSVCRYKITYPIQNTYFFRKRKREREKEWKNELYLAFSAIYRYKIQNTKYKIQNTKYKIQNIKYKYKIYKIQNTKYKI